MSRDEFWTEAFLRALTGCASTDHVRRISGDYGPQGVVDDAARIADYALNEVKVRKILPVSYSEAAAEAADQAAAAAAIEDPEKVPRGLGPTGNTDD